MSAIEATKLTGLVPDRLKVRSARILLDSLEVQADIGFHEFEIGSPQRLLVTVEIWLDDLRPRRTTTIRRGAWNYDFLRTRSRRSRRPGATICRRRWRTRCSTGLPRIRGVRDVRIRTSKPDVYPEAQASGLKSLPFQERGPGAETAL